MTGQPPTFEITYSRRFVAEMLRHFQRSGPRPWLLPAVQIAVPPVLGGLAVWMAYPHRHHLASSGMVGNLCPLIACALMFIFYPHWVTLVMYSRARRLPMYRQPIRVEVTPQGLSTITTVGRSELTWAAFFKAQQFPDGFLLLQGPRARFWRPGRALVAGRPADVAALVRAHRADFRPV